MNLRLVAVAALVALTVAACGGGATEEPQVASLEGNDQPTTTTTTPVDVEQTMLEYTQCLRDNGIDVEDPTVDADGNLRFSRPSNLESIDREQMRVARDACAPILEKVALSFGNIDRTQIEDTLYEYAACMRENGYDMPDPDFSSFGTPGSGSGDGRPRGPFGDSIDPNDPAFIAANEVCQDIFTQLPGFLGGGGRGPGGGPGGGGGS